MKHCGFLDRRIETPFSSRSLRSATRMSERSIEMLFKEAYGFRVFSWVDAF
jgi:transcriptional regulator GlxA family with amidase domain